METQTRLEREERHVGSRGRIVARAADEAAPDAERPIFGRVLGGKYRVVAFAGEGTAGAVYRGEALRRSDVASTRTIGIEIVAPALAGNPEFCARFRREAKTARRIVHPGVARMVDDGLDEGWLFAVFELPEGEPLAERLGRGAMSTRRIVACVDALLAAISAAHERGVVHGRLDPERIVLPTDDDAPVAIVRGLGVAVPEGAVPTRATFLAPEQRAGNAADTRSDLYAVGAILSTMLGEDPAAVETTPVAVPAVASCRALLLDVARRAMRADPSKRFGSARAMRVAVRRARLVGSDDGGPRPSLPSTKPVEARTLVGMGAMRDDVGATRGRTVKMAALPSEPDPSASDARAPHLEPLSQRTLAMAAMPTASASRLRSRVDGVALAQGIAVFVGLTLAGLLALFVAFEHMD